MTAALLPRLLTHFRMERSMLARSFAASVLAAGVLFAPPPAQAQTSFASPEIRAEGFAQPPNVTCYLSNVGKNPVRVTGLVLRGDAGPAPVRANTCGARAGFDLAPGKVCFLEGATPTSMFHSCRATVAAAASIRGGLELRDANFTVLKAVKFRVIASPAMFTAPDQRRMRCAFENVGTTAATLRNVRVVNSLGTSLPLRVDYCASASEATIPAGKKCVYSHTSAIPITDLQCVASVNRRANIRGTMEVSTLDGQVNWHPLE